MGFENFAFVLVSPKSPGNVGSAARALKNMGFGTLRMVAPRNWSYPRAAAMAVHGEDVLAAATVHQDLPSAIADRTLVIGTTARTGPYRNEARSLRSYTAELAQIASERVAIVFGPEESGLSNEDLKLCNRLVTIPTAPQYASLNVAQAVLIFAYELMLAGNGAREIPHSHELAPALEVHEMVDRLQGALVDIGFLPEDNPDHIMFAIRAMLGRAGLRPRDLDIFNGIVRQLRWFARGGRDTIAAKRIAGIKLR